MINFAGMFDLKGKQVLMIGAASGIGRASCLGLALTAAALFACIAPASAQAPAASQSPVRIVIGFPPGGATDNLARVLADQLRNSTGETVVVENRPGASSRLAIESVKRASPDGKTILIASTAPFVIFPMTYKRPLGYDVDKDFVPVAHLVNIPTMVSTGPNQPYKTLPEYIAWLREHPGQNSVGLNSLGGILHFALLQLGKNIGVPLNLVAYKGGAQLATDTVGGHIRLGTDALASQLELHRGGKLRIMAVSGNRRFPSLPDVPTLKEAGVDAFDYASASFGAYLPAGTPRQIVDNLERALLAAMRKPQVQAQLASLGLEPTGLPGTELARMLQAERKFWQPIVESSGFKNED